MTNRILVIVVTYNGMKWIDRCLGSVVGHLLPVDVLVVDNGSTDGTAGYIRENYPSVLLHSTGENYGFGKANNIGFRYALDNDYEYVYLLNQDAWVFPETFPVLVEAMKSHPEYGVLSPIQMTASMNRPDPRFAVKCLSLPLEEYRPGVIVDVPFVMAAHWMISRRCLQAVGGFSPAFKHYGEDDNWLQRAVYHGFKIGFLGGAYAVHDRELRPAVKAFRMRLKCVGSLVKISSPLNVLPFRLVFQPLEMLAISAMYLSADVLKEIIPMIRRYPYLVECRRKSMHGAAFLDSDLDPLVLAAPDFKETEKV